MNTLSLFLSILIVVLLLLSGPCHLSSDSDNDSDDYYRLLGIERSADNREIRKAFKKLALVLHPDKNPGDQKAHDKFLKINRAYEVLKDEETRNIYNVHGEKGLNRDNHNSGWNSGGGGGYQRWEYYNDNFGIYDNDEEIATLGQADFQQTVTNTSFIWFVNFYSARCSHCHQLAPEWRRLAKQLNRIVRIGAVNCQEDRPLCQSESIRSYPSLVLYPDRIRFEGNRNLDQLLKFVLKNLDSHQKDVNVYSSQLDLDRLLARIQDSSKWFLVIACFEDGQQLSCLPEDTRIMLRYKLRQILQIVELNCFKSEKLCEHFGIEQSMLALFPSIKQEPKNYFEIMTTSSVDDLQQDSISATLIFDRIMSKFPKVPVISNRLMKSITKCLRLDSSGTNRCTNQMMEELNTNTVIAFVKNDDGTKSHDFEIELKSLIAFMPDVSVFKLICNNQQPKDNVCDQFFIKKYPSIIALSKKNLGDFSSAGKCLVSYEHFHGSKANAIDVLNFARESFQSSIQTLNPKLFESLVQKSSTGVENDENRWIVEFHAPWCPMCKTVLQKIRQASHHFQSETIRNNNNDKPISFGTVDCTVHHQLCRQYNIMSYPTTLFYNQSLPHQYPHGSGDEESSIIEFVQDIVDFKVVDLDPIKFSTLVEKRNADEIWAVDFFSPFCQPCVRLGPVWRRLARMIDNDQIGQTIRVGQLDCARWNRFCNDLMVHAYPTIRVYPAPNDLKHRQPFYKYNSQDKRSLYMIRSWLYEYYPSPVQELGTDHEFDKILTSNEPHLVDFYLPWAFSSRKFAPDFIRMSKNLTQVKFVRLNCQRFQHVCEQAYVQYFPTIRLYSGKDAKKSSRRQSSEGMEIEVRPLEQMAQMIRSFLTSQPTGGGAERTVKDEL